MNIMVRLSVNINKIATIRNARGGKVPDVLLAAVRCQEYGAQGITVHPRPDERHIRRAAWQYIDERNDPDLYYRFDIIAVLIPEKGEPDIRHIPDAFGDE